MRVCVCVCVCVCVVWCGVVCGVLCCGGGGGGVCMCVCVCVCVCKLLVCLICNFCIFNNFSLSSKRYTMCTVMQLMFSHVLISLMR